MHSKITYPTKKEAKEKIKELKKKKKVTRFWYYCHLCEGFHITRNERELIDEYYPEGEELEYFQNCIRTRNNIINIECNGKLSQYHIRKDNVVFVIIQDNKIMVTAKLKEKSDNE